MTDKEIIEHLQQNKYSLALKGLYDIFPQAKTYIKANSGSAFDAEDIFQDALVVLWKKVQSNDFLLSVSLKNYLLAIVKNCWLQELRKRKKLPPGEPVPDIPDAITNEEAGFIFAKAAFELLGEKCRQLLIMFYFKKENYTTIAATLSFSDEKIAKNQKYRCLQKARETYITLSNNNDHE